MKTSCFGLCLEPDVVAVACLQILYMPVRPLTQVVRAEGARFLKDLTPLTVYLVLKPASRRVLLNKKQFGLPDLRTFAKAAPNAVGVTPNPYGAGRLLSVGYRRVDVVVGAAWKATEPVSHKTAMKAASVQVHTPTRPPLVYLPNPVPGDTVAVKVVTRAACSTSVWNLLVDRHTVATRVVRHSKSVAKRRARARQVDSPFLDNVAVRLRPSVLTETKLRTIRRVATDSAATGRRTVVTIVRQVTSPSLPVVLNITVLALKTLPSMVLAAVFKKLVKTLPLVSGLDAFLFV